MLPAGSHWRPADVSTAIRFREARELAKLKIGEVAERAGISDSCVRDLEMHDDELITVDDLAHLQKFALILGVKPRELVGTPERSDAIAPVGLASAIRKQCATRGLTPHQFSELAGWDITEAINAPELFLTGFSLDGIQDICHDLGIDWTRCVEGL